MANYSDLAPPSSEWTDFMNAKGLIPPPANLSLDERRNYLNETRAKLHRDFFGATPGPPLFQKRDLHTLLTSPKIASK